MTDDEREALKSDIQTRLNQLYDVVDNVQYMYYSPEKLAEELTDIDRLIEGVEAL